MAAEQPQIKPESFETVLERILAADEQARRMAAQADEKKRAALAHVSEQSEQIRTQYLERADRRIEVMREQEEALATEKLRAEAEAHTKRLDALAEIEAEFTQEWAGELFARVIADRS